MVDNRNNVLGMITRKDITHHALDEALLRLHAQSAGATGGESGGPPNAAAQRLVSLDQEVQLSVAARTRRDSNQHEPSDRDGLELDEHVAPRGSE